MSTSDQKRSSPRPRGPIIGLGGKLFILAGFIIVPTIVMNLAGAGAFDPTQRARELGDVVENPDPRVPPHCFVNDPPGSDSCWVCHQERPDPSKLTTRFESMPWSALTEDHQEIYAQISDGEIDAWIRMDNLSTLWEELEATPHWKGPIPRIDLQATIDVDGFLDNGSGWRAVRQVPFPGLSWPVLGRQSQVWMRLGRAFHRDAEGVPSREVARLNHALVRAAVRWRPDAAVQVDPVDEALIGFDLDGDGEVGGDVDRIRSLPENYAGQAASIAIEVGQHPLETEFIQTLHYLAPSADHRFSRRLRELRYAFREEPGSEEARRRRHTARTTRGVPEGSALEGHLSLDGWRMLGFLENFRGQLRAQTEAEARSCFGCHEGLKTTSDGIFTTLRQLPGTAGWGRQDLRGMPDLAPRGLNRGELALYVERAGRADPFAEASSLEARIGKRGRGLEELGPADPPDLATILWPTRERCYELNRALRHAVSLHNATEGGRWTRPAPLEILTLPVGGELREHHSDYRLPLGTR